MPPKKQNPRFRGIFTEASKTSTPEGFWAELENVDIYTMNRGRRRPGLLPVLPRANDGILQAISGAFATQFSAAVESGTPVSGSFDIFDKFIQPPSGAEDDGLDDYPQFALTASDNLYPVQSGDLVIDSVASGTSSYGAYGVAFDQDTYGQMSASQYAQIVWTSGQDIQGVPEDRVFARNAMGVAVRVDAPNRSAYLGFLTPTSHNASNYNFYSATIIKMVSGIAVVTSTQPYSAAPPEGGILHIRVDSTHTVWLEQDEAAIHSWQDLGTNEPVITSGVPGLAALITREATHSGHAGWNYVDGGFEGGTTTVSSVVGMDNTRPSGAAPTIVAQNAHGQLHYFYVDLSGAYRLLENPVRD